MATGTAEFIDATTAAALVPEVWSQMAIVQREAALVFAGLANRGYEKDVLRFGDTINIHSVGNLSTVSKSLTANAATTYETVTESNIALTIASWDYSAIAIETATARQTLTDMLELYAPKQGYALGLAIDDALAGLPDDFSQTQGVLTQELTYEQMLRSKQYLDDADAPLDDRAIVISPAQTAGFYKLDTWVHRDYAKLNDGFGEGVKKSYVGTWLNMPVYQSTNVEGSNSAGHDNAMFHREAIALVVQMKPTTHRMFDTDYLAEKVVVEQLSGVRELRDDHGVWLQGA